MIASMHLVCEWPAALAVFIVFLSVFYAFLGILLMLGLHKTRLRSTRRTARPIPANPPRISVLVCARNEAKNLPACLNHLLNQDYPGPWDLWIADDRSSDETPQILEQYHAQFPEHLHIVRIDQTPPDWCPKKFALTSLAQRATGDIFVLTDADCSVPRGWLSALIRQFTPETDWVSGYSWLDSPGAPPWLAGMQTLDFMSHRTVDAATVGLGFPITTCGQNLAYRSRVFFELNGFEGISHRVGGDDDLLMHKLARRRKSAIHYCTDRAAHVRSLGKTTWRGAWEQRKRWASKTIAYNPGVIAVLSLVFLFYCSVLVMTTYGAVAFAISGNPSVLYCGLGLWLWKMLWDGLVMVQGWITFGSRGAHRWFIPLALLHIPLIVAAVLYGIFGNFDWKGRAKHSDG